MKLLERARRNFAFSTAGTALNFVISLVFAGMTIRYLGAERGGYFMALAALTGFSAVIGDFGMGAPAIRRVAALNAAGDLARARRVVGSLAVASLAASAVFAVPVALFVTQVVRWAKLSPENWPDAYSATVLTAITYVLIQLSNAWRSAYAALERYDISTTLDGVFNLSNGLAGMAVLLLHPTMTAVAGTRLCLLLVRFMVDVMLLRRLMRGVPWPTWAWEEVRGMAAFSGWVYLSTLGTQISGRINSVVLTSFLGAHALPYYEMPQRLYTQAHTVLASQTSFLLPMLSSLGDGTLGKLARIQDRLRWFVALSSGAFYSALAIAGPTVIGFLVTPEFAHKAQWAIYLACLQGWWHAQMIPTYHASYSLGWGRPNAIVPFVQSALVVLTTIVLAPRYGFNGAALAQLWVIPATLAHIAWVNGRIMSGHWLQDALRPLVSPLIMCAIWISLGQMLARLLPQGLIGSSIAVAAGGLAGAAVLWLLERHFLSAPERMETLFRAIRTRLPGQTQAGATT